MSIRVCFLQKRNLTTGSRGTLKKAMQLHGKPEITNTQYTLEIFVNYVLQQGIYSVRVKNKEVLTSLILNGFVEMRKNLSQPSLI